MELNKTKCKFGLNEVKYVGQIFSFEGVRGDPSKIEAIVDMPVPENASDVHRFLGMVTYLGKFLPNLSDKSARLRKMQLGTGLKSILKNFGKCKIWFKLSVDASKAGMGAVLLQLHKEGSHPVAYASWSLNSSEKRYAQIEKETFAILFGAERFNHYVYDNKFSVESDH